MPDGQYIAKILYWEGNNLDSIVFVTDQGVESPKFGGDGGDPYEFVLPPNTRLNGIYGYHRNKEYFRGLGFFYSEFKQYPLQKTPEFGTSNIGKAF